MNVQAQSSLWSWIAGYLLVLAGGQRTPAQLIAFHSQLGNLDYLPEYAKGLARAPQMASAVAYLSSRNLSYDVSRVMVMNHLKPFEECSFSNAGLLVTPDRVNVIHEGDFDLVKFPQGLVMTCLISDLRAINLLPNNLGIELKFLAESWATQIIRLFVSPVTPR